MFWDQRNLFRIPCEGLVLLEVVFDQKEIALLFSDESCLHLYFLNFCLLLFIWISVFRKMW